LQPCDEGLLTFPLDGYKKPRSDNLRWHTSADVRHGPKFTGEVLFHQTRFAA
jgi:hypothetical protein